MTEPKQWRIRDCGVGNVDLFDSRDNYVCTVANRSKAEELVLCVNAHAALVEACLAAFDFVDSGGEDGSPLKIIKQLTAALAAADKE